MKVLNLLVVLLFFQNGLYEVSTELSDLGTFLLALKYLSEYLTMSQVLFFLTLQDELPFFCLFLHLFFSYFKLQNLGEAEYVVAVFMYMCLLGYPADRISILTTYNGQKHLIRDVINQRCGNNPLIGRPNKVPLKIYQSLEQFWFLYF